MLPSQLGALLGAFQYMATFSTVENVGPVKRTGGSLGDGGYRKGRSHNKKKIKSIEEVKCSSNKDLFQIRTLNAFKHNNLLFFSN